LADEAITIDELRQRIKSHEVVLLDVRSLEEFAAGRIPGARSIPTSELEKRLRELARRSEIIACCRGPYCVFADEAVSLLRSRGYRAVRLDAGLPDWKAQGFPVEGCENAEG
jgi:ArsR family transcriptional regulator